MRIVLRTIAVLLLAVGVPLAWFVPVNADAPMQAGWWFKLRAASTPEAPAAPVPAPVPVEVTATRPPTVPEGGLLIANDPSGPAAVAAVQLTADEGATGTLTLKLADGGAGEPLIVACPAVGVWTAAEGGAWDERPDADCGVGKIAGTVTDDTVTFALDPSVATPGGGYDVVLMPDPDSGTPFQTPFEAPGDDAWAPVGGSSSADAAGDFATTGGDLGTSPASGGAGEGAFDSGGGSFDAGSGGGDFGTDFAAGDAGGGSFDSSTPAVDDVAAGESPGGAQTDVGQDVETAAAQPAASTDTTQERLVAIGLLVAIAAGLFWVSSRTGAAMGDARAAGVGRFARPRSGRPNGLT